MGERVFRNGASGLCLGVVVALLSASPAQADLSAVVKDLASAAAAQYMRIDTAAKTAAARERGEGSCRDRASGFLARIDEAASMARLSADIYDHPQALEMKRLGLTTQSWRDNPGRLITAYRDPVSEGYAEAVDDGDTVNVIFRGTQLMSLKDMMADVAQFAGTVPTKYRWAEGLIAELRAKHEGRRLVASGHSLGGGLAMYAALHHPIEAVALNPAGLSPVALKGLTPGQVKASNARVTTFIARSGAAIEPVSAVSLAGDTSIIGRRYLVDIGTILTPVRRHDAYRLADSLAALAQRKSAISPEAICDNDLGFERR